MQNIKNRLLRFYALLLLALCGCLTAQAQTAPTYTGNAFDAIQEMAGDGMLFFGYIIAAAIIVTGFFLGRRWLKRV